MATLQRILPVDAKKVVTFRTFPCDNKNNNKKLRKTDDEKKSCQAEKRLLVVLNGSTFNATSIHCFFLSVSITLPFFPFLFVRFFPVF